MVLSDVFDSFGYFLRLMWTNEQKKNSFTRKSEKIGFLENEISIEILRKFN